MLRYYARTNQLISYEEWQEWGLADAYKYLHSNEGMDYSCEDVETYVDEGNPIDSYYETEEKIKVYFP